MKSLMIRPTLPLLTLALAAAASTVQAQLTEAPVGSFLTPSYRGQTGTESAFWNDSYTNAFGGANQASTLAPGGVSLANASVTQTTSGAFLLSHPGGDIYSFSSINTFVLNYSVSNPANFPNGVGSVFFQTETVGAELDYSSVQLSYTTAAGTQTLPALITEELFRSTGDSGFGSTSDVLREWQWNLPLGDDVTSFSIAFNASDVSLGMERTMLDVAPFNVAAVPEPSSMALAGIGGAGLLLWTRRLKVKKV